MMNMQGMIMEGMRQGQRETELRLVMMKGFSGQFGPHPLEAPFSNDRELLKLEIDVKRLQTVMWDGYFRSPFSLLPCFWPHQIILGMPCSFVCFTLPKVEESAAAHRLILREKTLLYAVDPYPSDGSFVSGMEAAKPICFQGCMGTAGGFVEVIPLQFVESCTVEPCMMQQCGADVAPETLVVRTSGGMMNLPAAAVDAPKNGAEFCAAVMAQVERVKASGELLEPALEEAYTKFSNPAALASNPMLMMGMMGGSSGQRGMRHQQYMMMQQQAMMQQQGMMAGQNAQYGGQTAMMQQQAMMAGQNAQYGGQMAMMQQQAMMAGQNAQHGGQMAGIPHAGTPVVTVQGTIIKELPVEPSGMNRV